jgi:hypothetical protein
MRHNFTNKNLASFWVPGLLVIFVSLLSKTSQFTIQNSLFQKCLTRFSFDYNYFVVMESSLARLGSGSSRNFLLLLEKLEPKNQQSLIGSTNKKFRLE